MTNVAVTNTFSAGTLIESAKVNQNFSDLVTFLNSTGVSAYQDGSIAGADLADSIITTSKEASMAHCYAYISSAQAIGNSANTFIQFNAETEDTGAAVDGTAMHDNVTNNSRVTVQRDGLYLINAQVVFDANSTGVRTISILQNATNTLFFADANAASAGESCLSGTVVRRLTLADYVGVRVNQNSGGSLNAAADGDGGTFLSVTRIGK